MNNSSTSKTPSITNKKFYPYPERKQVFKNSVASSAPQQKEATEVELTLFHYLLEMKFLNTKQIIRKFPKLADLPANHTDQAKLDLMNPEDELFTLITRQIKDLCMRGYLKCSDPVITDTSLIHPTSKSYETLKAKYKDKDIPQIPVRHFPFGVNHDLILNDLRIKFEELNFLNRWVSEKTMEEIPFIHQTFQKLPDAICKKKNDKSYFLELENSKKSGKRYEERIQEFKSILAKKEIVESGIEGVVFICTDIETEELIRNLLPRSRQFSCIPIQKYLKDFQK